MATCGGSFSASWATGTLRLPTGSGLPSQVRARAVTRVVMRSSRPSASISPFLLDHGPVTLALVVGRDIAVGVALAGLGQPVAHLRHDATELLGPQVIDGTGIG